MTNPYMWVREYPASFDPQSGGEPASTDFSDVELPGYSPLYQDDLRGELVAALTASQTAIRQMQENGAPQAFWDDIERANVAALTRATT